MQPRVSLSKVWRTVDVMNDAPLLVGHIKAGYNREAMIPDDIW